MGGHETRSAARLGVDIDDGVVQTADVGDDRDGAVAHGLHLSEATGFEAAGHEEEIRTRSDAMGERLVVSVAEHHPFGILGGDSGERVDKMSLTGTEHDELAINRFEVPGDLGDDVDALLLRESGDHREQGTIGRGQSHLHSQCVATYLLTKKISSRIWGRERRIILGIPELGVDPVEDADDRSTAITQHAIESASGRRSADLCCIRGAHRHDGIAQPDGPGERVA